MYSVAANLSQKLFSQISSQNFTYFSNSSINTSAQNIFGQITPANAMNILSLALTVLFPLLIVIFLLMLMIGYITDSKKLKEKALIHIKDVGLVIIIAIFVNIFGFNILYNWLHIGYFFNQDFKMYYNMSDTFIGLWTGGVGILMTVKGIGTLIIKDAMAPGVAETGGVAIALSTKAILLSIVSILNPFINYSLEGFKATWVVLFMLSFAQITSITYLLPIGIVFRGFTLTRTVGAGFISLAIGLGFIFPIVTYIITSAAFYIKNIGILHAFFGFTSFSISSYWYMNIILYPVHLALMAIIIPLNSLLSYSIFLLLMATVIPIISVMLTSLSVIIMYSVIGGEGTIFIPKMFI